ncbi:MAG: diaminopimelate decarboxylase [Firmicutes bacterium]|nr:diaminopimelate decarboxylase [Bacillota bacterium]
MVLFLEWLGVNDKGHLEMEGCDLVELAHNYGTPLFVYNEVQIRRKCREYLQAMERCYPHGEIIYAGKAFLTMAMCSLIAGEGLGLDVVSGGELHTAIAANFPMARIYFHGNNKSPEELAMALDSGVGRIVVDSVAELELLNGIAGARGRKARILLRIKPGITAHTHSFIQTGQVDSKFGLGIDDGEALAAARMASSFSHVELKGLHCHIGSQIYNFREPFRLTAGKMITFIDELRRVGMEMEELNLGGGLAIRYTSEDRPVGVNDFIAVLTGAIKEGCVEKGLPLPQLMIEPGRSIIGEAGLTLYTVGNIKEIPGVRTYVAVDGGMMDNLRAVLYGAVYERIIADRARASLDSTVTIAGKACESADILIRDLKVARPRRGDILAVFSTGAYHFSMYSGYNRNPRPAVVFVRGGEAELVVKRESYEDIVGLDILPPHFEQEHRQNRGPVG